MRTHDTLQDRRNRKSGRRVFQSSRPSLHSWLSIESVASYLALSCSVGGEFCDEAGMSRNLGQIQSLAESCSGSLKENPALGSGYSLCSFSFLQEAPTVRRSIHLSLWTLAAALFVGVALYLSYVSALGFVLRYAHEHGTRKWLRAKLRPDTLLDCRSHTWRDAKESSTTYGLHKVISSSSVR